MEFFLTHPISDDPLPEDERRCFYDAFVQAFRVAPPEWGELTRLAWGDDTTVGPEVLDSPILTSSDQLFVILEAEQSVFRAPWPVIRHFFSGEFDHGEYYIVDRSLRWCVAVTHDWVFLLKDPDGLFAESR